MGKNIFHTHSQLMSQRIANAMVWMCILDIALAFWIRVKEHFRILRLQIFFSSSGMCILRPIRFHRKSHELRTLEKNPAVPQMGLPPLLSIPFWENSFLKTVFRKSKNSISLVPLHNMNIHVKYELILCTLQYHARASQEILQTHWNVCCISHFLHLNYT